jgi:glycosyltransferase involved in cell wall biosynthesis
MRKEPFFSVIVPTYNRADLIGRCISTVTGQTYSNWELIIVDDGSTDTTASVVDTFLADERVRYFRFPNMGANVARNIGIGLSSGKFLAFLDSDDSWAENRLEVMEREILTNSSAAVFITDFFAGTSRKNIFARHLFASAKAREILLSHNYFGGATNLVVSKDLIAKVGGFDKALRACQDHDMYLRLHMKSDFHHVPGTSAIYNTDSGNRISKKNNGKLMGHVDFFRKYREQMTPLARLLSRKKIAVITYQMKSPKLLKYLPHWALVILLCKIYDCNDERDLYFKRIPFFAS